MATYLHGVKTLSKDKDKDFEKYLVSFHNFGTDNYTTDLG